MCSLVKMAMRDMPNCPAETRWQMALAADASDGKVRKNRG